MILIKDIERFKGMYTLFITCILLYNFPVKMYLFFRIEVVDRLYKIYFYTYLL